MLNIPNPLNVPSDVLLRELCEHVPAPIRDTLEAWHDAHESRDADISEAEDNVRAEMHDELNPYRDAWQALFDAWEDCADGRWPAESPEDGTLAAAMESDIRKGAEALALCKELAAMPGRFPAGVRDKLAELLAD